MKIQFRKRSQIKMEMLGIVSTGNDSGREFLIIREGSRQSIVLLGFLISTVWTLIMTLIPVVTNVGPTDYYANQNNWFTGSDIIRFIEPIFGLPFNFFLFLGSGVLGGDVRQLKNSCLVALFILGGAIYVQGASTHGAAAMFKNALGTLNLDDDGIQNLHYYMRTVWEHEVGHYLYATGYAIMNVCQCWAYRHEKAEPAMRSYYFKMLIVFASVMYGFLVAGVAIEFPSGCIVAIVFIVVYGFIYLGGYIFFQSSYNHDESITCFGGVPVVHFFALGYVVAFIIIIIWVATVGGLKSRDQAGVA
jgi:hypothetical protein